MNGKIKNLDSTDTRLSLQIALKLSKCVLTMACLIIKYLRTQKKRRENSFFTYLIAKYQKECTLCYKRMRKQGLSYLFDGHVNWCYIYAWQFAASVITENAYTIWNNNPTFRNLFYIHTHFKTDFCIRGLISPIFTIAKELK